MDSKRFWVLTTGLVMLTLSGCGGGGGGSSAVVLPLELVSLSPADGAADVAISTTLSATLSQAVDCSAIPADPLLLEDAAANAVSGSVACSGDTLTFTPDSALVYNTRYTATLKAGIPALTGVALDIPSSWSFTTVSATPPSGSVTISGTPAENEVLTATNDLSDADGLGTISYQWSRDGVAISGATGATYQLATEDVGAVITVTASYTDGAGHAESVTSDPTAIINVANILPTGSVTISGTTAEKEALSVANNLADANGLGAITYQWQRDGIDVDGETGSSYQLSYQDIGAQMSVIASYTDGAGYSESVSSALTATVSGVNEWMAFFSDDNMFVNTSVDAAASWQGAMTFAASDSSIGPYHYDGSAASDGKGNIVAVWGSEDMPGFGSYIDIAYKYSHDNGATWSLLDALNSGAAADTGDNENPSIATNGNGRWIVVWDGPNTDGGSNDDILFSISDDNGATWTTQAELDSETESATDHAPVIVNDGGNNWLVVWRRDGTDSLSATIGTESDIVYSYSSDNGQTWSARAALDSRATADGTAYDGPPSIAMDANGNVIAVWESYNDLAGEANPVGSDVDIFLSSSSDFGKTWTQSRAVNSNAISDSGWDGSPVVALDNEGNAIIVWESWENLDGTAGTDSDIFYISTADGGQDWDIPKTLNSDANGDSTYDKDPVITTDKGGNWVVSWRDNGLISSSTSSNVGTTWSDPISVDMGISSSLWYPILVVH